jgi:hypothetical protein
MTFSLETVKYPWLAGFDKIDTSAAWPTSGSDQKITDEDIDFWVTSTPELSSYSDASPELKRRLFLVEQTSMEARFKLARLSMVHLPDGEGQLRTKGNALLTQLTKKLDKSVPPFVESEKVELDGLRRDFEFALAKADIFSGGIGIAFAYADDSLYIKNLLEDGPAHQAGLRVGDRIVAGGAIGSTYETSVKVGSNDGAGAGFGKDFFDIAKSADGFDPGRIIADVLLKGALGSKTTLYVARGGDETPCELIPVEVTRSFNLFPSMMSAQDFLFPLQYAARYHEPIYGAMSLWDDPQITH